jgi:hypothetical protein
MNMGDYWWLAAVIAAHTNRQVVGRARLIMTVKLLQGLGLPTRYLYTLFFGGPYAEGIHSDLDLLKVARLVEETRPYGQEGAPSLLQASPKADAPELEPYRPAIRLMEQTEEVVLELAATYLALRLDRRWDHARALETMRPKKADKWTPEREAKALELLRVLKLPSGAEADGATRQEAGPGVPTQAGLGQVLTQAEVPPER